jgi:hypothetical protein
MAVIGGAGMLSVSFVLPIIGKWYDQGIAARTSEGTAPAGDALAAIQTAAGLEALGKVAVLPLVLTGIFIALYLVSRRSANPVTHA